jgi:hypothetical protein
MYRLNQRLYNSLAQPGLFDEREIDAETWGRVRRALEEVSLRLFRRDPALKQLLADFERAEDRAALLEGLDAWPVENELYREVTPPTVLEQITREDLRLVCWEAVGIEYGMEHGGNNEKQSLVHHTWRRRGPDCGPAVGVG